jgi:hypothetical protein
MVVGEVIEVRQVDNDWTELALYVLLGYQALFHQHQQCRLSRLAHLVTTTLVK